MEELTNRVKLLSCSTPLRLTPNVQAADDVIHRAQALENEGRAQEALDFALDAEQHGNVQPWKKLLEYADLSSFLCNLSSIGIKCVCRSVASSSDDAVTCSLI
jgi:hypothetical protein